MKADVIHRQILEKEGTYGYLINTNLLDGTAWTFVSDYVVCRIFEGVWNTG